jgi:ribosome recycling factor
MFSQNIDSTKVKMQQAVDFVNSELSKIRTGRANPDMLNKISVNFYDSDFPINQLANISVLDAITLSIQPFDKSAMASIEKAIRDSDLGLNPSNNGNSIIIPFPPLSMERRQEFVKLAARQVEEGRVSIRNIRREIIQVVKKIDAEEKLPEDEVKRFMDDIQNLTDEFIGKLNDIFSLKEKEIIEK